jgi:DNA polymerase-3 subunit beta
MKILVDPITLISELEKFSVLATRYCYQSEHITFVAESDILTLYSTDYAVSMSVVLTCIVEEQGQITVATKPLKNLLEEIATGDLVTLSKVPDKVLAEGRLLVSTVTGRYRLTTNNFGEDKKADFKLETELKLEGKLLLGGINATAFCASTDDTKMALNGVNLVVSEEIVCFCAINGHILSYLGTDSHFKDNPDANFLITNKSCLLLKKIVTNQDTITIQLGKKTILLNAETEETRTTDVVIYQIGNNTIESSLEHIGMFPHYNQLIPRQFERKVLVERQPLIDAIKQVGAIAEQKNNTIKLLIDRENQQVILSCEVPDVGTSKVELPAQISGDSLLYAFNITYLLAGLNSMNSTEVQINLNQKTTPVIINPLSNTRQKFLIMPLQIRD